MRRITKQINVGKVKVGSDYPITVQSMTNTLTTDIEATVKQIKSLEDCLLYTSPSPRDSCASRMPSSA